MKRIVYFAGLLILSGLMGACSDDFLSGNKRDLYILTDTLFVSTDQQNARMTVQLPQSINSEFTIFQQPKWLSFSTMHGTIKDGVLPLSYTVEKEKIINWNPNVYTTYYASMVVDADDLGLISMTVACVHLQP